MTFTLDDLLPPWVRNPSQYRFDNIRAPRFVGIGIPDDPPEEAAPVANDNKGGGDDAA